MKCSGVARVADKGGNRLCVRSVRARPVVGTSTSEWPSLVFYESAAPSYVYRNMNSRWDGLRRRGRDQHKAGV